MQKFFVKDSENTIRIFLIAKINNENKTGLVIGVGLLPANLDKRSIMGAILYENEKMLDYEKFSQFSAEKSQFNQF